MTEPLPDTPVGFLTLLLTGAGAVFGLLTVWLTNQVIALWEARQGGLPISGTKRRWISIAVPVALVFLGYFGLVALGSLALTGQTFYLACMSAFGAVGAKQVAFATVESAQKPPVVTNIGTQTNIAQVAATDDVFLGSTVTEQARIADAEDHGAPPPTL